MRKLNIIGNLGSDARTVTIGDKKYLSLSVATTEVRNKEVTTIWVNCIIHYTDGYAEYLKKGKKIFATGTMSIDEYKDKEENNKYQIKIWVDHLELL